MDDRYALDSTMLNEPGGVAGIDDSGRVNDAAGRPMLAVEQLDQEMFLATPERFPTLDLSGSTSSRSVLQQIAWSAPAGSRIVLPPGRLLLQGGSSIANTTSASDATRRAVNFDFSRVELLIDMTATPFSMVGGFEAAVTASAVAAVAVPSDNTSFATPTPGIVLTVPSTAALSWTRGDTIKVVSDDLIPEARPVEDGKGSRLGQNFIFHSKTPTTITLLGAMVDAFATNIRVMRYRPAADVRLRFGVVDLSDAAIAARTAINIVSARSLVAPLIETLRVKRAAAPVVSIEGCQEARIDGLRVNYATDDPGTASLGYGIIDKSSQDTQVNGLFAKNVRHAYTDDSGRVAAGSTEYHAYGRTLRADVSRAKVVSASNAGIDTHQASAYGKFSDITVVDSEAGLQLRGREHTARGITTRNSRFGIRVFNESEGGQSWGHTIDGFDSRGDEYPVYHYLNPTGHPTASARELRPTEIRNVVARDVRNIAFALWNSHVRISGAHVEMAATVTDGGGIGQGINSQVLVAGDLIYDLSKVTTGTSLNVWGLGTATSSVFEHGVARTIYPSNTASRMSRWLRCGTGSTVKVERQSIGGLPSASVVYDDFASNGWFEFIVATGGSKRSSEDVTVTGAAILDAASFVALGRTRQNVSVYLSSSGTDRTIGGFPFALKAGILAVVFNNGATNTITLPNDSTKHIITNGTVALAPNQRVMLMSDMNGNWAQCAPVL